MRLHLGLQGAQPGLQSRPLEFLRAPGRLDGQSALAQAFAEQPGHRFHRLQRLAGRDEKLQSGTVLDTDTGCTAVIAADPDADMAVQPKRSTGSKGHRAVERVVVEGRRTRIAQCHTGTDTGQDFGAEIECRQRVERRAFFAADARSHPVAGQRPAGRPQTFEMLPGQADRDSAASQQRQDQRHQQGGGQIPYVEVAQAFEAPCQDQPEDQDDGPRQHDGRTMTQDGLHDIAPCQLVVLRHGRQAEWNSHESPLVTFDRDHSIDLMTTPRTMRRREPPVV
jgi:hypothetical protein